MKRIIYFYVTLMIGLLTACSGMNDSMDPYLSLGEIIYIAKSDSVKVYAGDERFFVEFWISDPRATEMTIYWSMRKNSVTVPIPEGYDKSVPFQVYVGRNEKTVEEGNYTIEMITRDIHYNTSVPDEYQVNVYGEDFASTLLNKYIRSIEFDESTSKLSISWGGAYSDKECGIQLSYTTTEGVARTESFTTEELKQTTVFESVDPTLPVTYTTLYLPEPTAIDTFYTEPAKVRIVKKVNVALGKATQVSDLLSPYDGSNAVDGVLTGNPSRWVTDDTNNAHWLIIDLGQEYPISAMETWNGDPTTKSFKLQMEQNGEWVDIHVQNNNVQNNYYSEFPEVKASKVRYYVPAYQTNRVRMYEIAIYSLEEY